MTTDTNSAKITQRRGMGAGDRNCHLTAVGSRFSPALSSVEGVLSSRFIDACLQARKPRAFTGPKGHPDEARRFSGFRPEQMLHSRLSSGIIKGMRTYEYRLYPNRHQCRRLDMCLIQSRQIYNQMLQHQKQHYHETGKCADCLRTACRWRPSRRTPVTSG